MTKPIASVATVSVTLPYPPSLNNMFFNVRGRGRVRSKEYDLWRAAATWALKDASQSGRLAGPYNLTVRVGRRDRRKRDLDNLIKPLNDALVTAGVVRDDSDCQRIDAAWAPGLDGVTVTVVATDLITVSQAAARSGCAGDGEVATPASPELAA